LVEDPPTSALRYAFESIGYTDTQLDDLEAVDPR
jgi:hypothetical protein